MFPFQEGETALHAAASRGHTESVRCLLEAGAELELLDKHGCSALHLALRRHHVPVALVLLEAGCPSDEVDNVSSVRLNNHVLEIGCRRKNIFAALREFDQQARPKWFMMGRETENRNEVLGRVYIALT